MLKFKKLDNGMFLIFGMALSYSAAIWVSNIQAAESGNTAPNAGDLRRTVPPLSEPKPANAPPLNIPRTKKRAPQESADALRVQVDRLVFEGNTLFDDTQLTALLSSWLERDLTLAEMKQMADEVSDTYRSEGYLAHAFIPPQPLDDNTLLISVVEGKVSQIAVTQDEGVRLQKNQIVAWMNQAVPAHSVVNTDRVDRHLLLLDDRAGLRASAKLRRSDKPGHSELVLSLNSGPRIEGLVHLSNSGSESTGAERLSANLKLNSPLNRGDQLGADLTLSEHSQFFRASYRNPLGVKGWSMGLEASALNYDLQGQVAALSSEGDTQGVRASLRYAQVRTRTFNLNIGLSLGSNHYDNNALNETTSAYKIHDVTLSLDADKIQHNRWSQFSLQFSQGNLDLGALDLSENSELPEDFSKLQYRFTQGWRFKPQYSARINLQGQYSADALDSAEQFSLGGPNAVRAYPVSEASGEVAHVASLDLARTLGSQWQVAAFYDYGHMQRRATVNTAGEQSYSLKGAGLSASWTSPKGWHLSAQLARRIGDNPNPTTSGRDHDGTLRENRVWFSLHRQF
mgnify:CR=1 FL=1